MCSHLSQQRSMLSIQDRNQVGSNNNQKKNTRESPNSPASVCSYLQAVRDASTPPRVGDGFVAELPPAARADVTEGQIDTCVVNNA